ncbi:MAG: hypothetical protein N2260_02215 [Syntrophobacterales bacterium]|nr:hypothetical protein [Syntrophobacterales bacterium]
MLKQNVEILKQDMMCMKGEFGRFKGKEFERSVREKYYAYFGKLLRKSKLVPFEEILSILDDLEERDSILNLDLIAKGQIKSTGKQVVLGVEVSYSLYEDDIKRASERAEILSRVLFEEVIPVVVGVEAKKEVETLADSLGVLLIKTDY